MWNLEPCGWFCTSCDTCDVMWCVMSCDVMIHVMSWYHVMWRVMSLMSWYHVIVTWCHLMSCDVWCVIPCDTMWYVWCHVMSCGTMWYHVMSCDVMWYMWWNCPRGERGHDVTIVVTISVLRWHSKGKNHRWKLQGLLYGLSHDGCVEFSTKLKLSG